MKRMVLKSPFEYCKYLRPYQSRTMAYYDQDPLLTLSTLNYKIEASILLSGNRQMDKLCFFETGAVQNVIHVGHLLDEVLLRMKKTTRW